MDLSGPVMKHFNQTSGMMYQNNGYCNNREDKQILILDTHTTLSPPDFSSIKTFTIDLYEPLKIDVLSDIYLDNFTTYNSVRNNTVPAVADNRVFVLGIDQFNIQSVSTIATFNNKIIIPNESTSTASSCQSHKSRKMNYICSINPQTLTKLSGSITNAKGGFIFDTSPNGFTAEFIIVARK
jgi:hypothetical protein